MDDEEIGVLTRSAGVVRRRLTVHDYHRMGEVGVLGPDERVELIEGEIIVMAPIGSSHSGTVNAVTRLLVRAVGDDAVVAVQNSVRLDEYSEPEPDFAVLRPRADDYRGAIPGPADVLLVVEVAASSLAFDRAVKAPLYARHGILEFWIVDVEAGEVDVRRVPEGGKYMQRIKLRRGDVLEPAGLPGVKIPVSAVVG